MAKYYLHGNCYLDCGGGPRLWQTGTVVAFDGAPAECMEPKDEAARVNWWAKHKKRLAAGHKPRYPYKMPEPVQVVQAAVAAEPEAVSEEPRRRGRPPTVKEHADAN